MRSRTRFATAVLITLTALSSGTVGTGTPASCTEAALDAKLVGGGNLALTAARARTP